MALSGRMHSGKTTAATRLRETHGFRRVAFADPLKQDILAMGFPLEDVVEKPDWMRTLMQAYGRARRAINIDHWIKAAEQQLLGSGEHAKIVIDDMRFPNEFDMLRRLGERADFDVWVGRITRLGYDYSKIPGSADYSEIALDRETDWDFTLQASTGDVHGIRKEMDKVVQTIGERR